MMSCGLGHPHPRQAQDGSDGIPRATQVKVALGKPGRVLVNTEHLPEKNKARC